MGPRAALDTVRTNNLLFTLATLYISINFGVNKFKIEATQIAQYVALTSDSPILCILKDPSLFFIDKRKL